MVEHWSIEIVNMIPSGPVLGFSVYTPDEVYDNSEFILYLLLVSVHIKWITI